MNSSGLLLVAKTHQDELVREAQMERAKRASRRNHRRKAGAVNAFRSFLRKRK